MITAVSPGKTEICITASETSRYFERDKWITVTVKKTPPYMKTVNVRWDLEPQKEIIYRNCFSGLGLRNQYAKIVSYKKSSYDDDYYRIYIKVKFESIRTLDEMSTWERDTFLRASAGRALCGYNTLALVDYKTGQTLNGGGSKYDVEAYFDDTTIREKEYQSSDGNYKETFRDFYMTATIYYPKTYKNLCIGVGGSRTTSPTSGDYSLWYGLTTFKHTSMYSNEDKNVMHFMRVG